MRRKVEELNDENQKLTQQATIDALTGIGNRAALQQKLDQEFAAANNLILLPLDEILNE